MLKFFFHRLSKVVYAMEVIGLCFTIGWLYQFQPHPPTSLTQILLAIYLAEYGFLRFCATKRWYSNAKRYEGIELQFKKAMVPTSYILALTSGAGLLTGSIILLWLAVLLLGIILHVNVILLTLHYKDKNKTPVNYYSHNKYLTRTT